MRTGDGRIAGSEPARPEPQGAPLPDGYSCRVPRSSDIAAIVKIRRAEQVSLIGESDVTEQELVSDWQLPRFDRERDAWLVEAPGGRLAGDAFIWDERPHLELFADFDVDHEDPQRRSVSAHLLAHIEVRAREYSAAADAHVLLGIPAEEGHEEKLRLLATHAFGETRRFYRMRIDLRDGFARPVWPHGIELQGFQRGRDEGAVHGAIEEAFAEHFRFAPMALDEWERYRFANERLDTGVWLVARDGAEVAGVCLAYDMPDRGYVDDLAVRKPWRGRGLGLALLLESFARLEARGQTEVVLGVDSENATGAVALYERAGMGLHSTRLFMEKEVTGLR